MTIRVLTIQTLFLVTVFSAPAHCGHQSSEVATASSRHAFTKGAVQIAQATQTCGWFAISVCVTNFDQAQRAVTRWGEGYVIDTSSPEYPRFTPGYFCAVSGPKSKSAARATARNMRRAGISKSAYVKNSC